MKQILTICSLALFLYSNELTMSLKQLTQLVTVQNNVNILINEEIKENEFIFLLSDNKNLITISQFNDMLKARNLFLVKYRDFLYVETYEKSFLEIENQLLEKNHYIKINYMKEDELKNIFQFYNIDYIFIRDKVMFTATHDIYFRILEVIKQYDNNDYRQDCEYFITSSTYKRGKQNINIEYVNNCPSEYKIWLLNQNQKKEKPKEPWKAPEKKDITDTKPKEPLKPPEPKNKNKGDGIIKTYGKPIVINQ